jgi:hypothetical protein
LEDEALYARALNLLSHGQYSVYEPREMIPDNKTLFQRILRDFLAKYEFNLPDLITQTQSSTPTENTTHDRS